MSEFSDDITNFIKDVARNNSFTNFEIQVRGGTEKSENYLGDVKFITIKDKNNKKKLDLVLKTIHTSQSVPMSLRPMFLREMFMYKTVFPQLLSFQREHNIEDAFIGIPKIFGDLDKEGSESILLEDLKSFQYKLWDRKLPMNREHVEPVLKTYAKFHAISFALKHFQPETFGELTKNLKDLFEEHLIVNEEEGLENLKKYAAHNFKLGYRALGDHPAKEKLMQLENEIPTILLDALKNNAHEHIIIHADCWSNNILFQYKDNTNVKKPTNVCLLDWQLSKAGLPILDIAYFLFVCTGKDILSDLDTYLNIYHESLSENIRNFGCDPENIYSYAVFKKHWQTFGKFAIWFAFIMVPQMLTEFKDNINLAEVQMKNEQELCDEFVKEKAKEINNRINKRIYDIIISMVDNKLI